MPLTRRCPLFIIGYARSGTTLLRALLGAHPEIHLVNEPALIRSMRTAGLGIHDVIPRESRARLFGELQHIGMCRKHLSTLSDESRFAFLEHDADLSFKEAYEALLPRPRAVPVWGEKSLGNVFYMGELHALYPEALFVHIVRDPRSTLLSYYRKKFQQGGSAVPLLNSRTVRFFARSAAEWRAWVGAVTRAGESLSDDVVMHVRYEDLVAMPEVELERITSALRLDYCEEMLDAEARRDDPALAPDTAYAHRKLAGPIDPTRARAWDELPEWACYIVEQCAKESMADFGYDHGQSKITLNQWSKIVPVLFRFRLEGLRAKSVSLTAL